jgi:bisphosphoglycerate-dependent phosphoglycerate mutase
MSLEKLDKDEILKVEVPTGEPKIYELDADLNILSSNFLN